jgi:hypothetical protein
MKFVSVCVECVYCCRKKWTAHRTWRIRHCAHTASLRLVSITFTSTLGRLSKRPRCQCPEGTIFTCAGTNVPLLYSENYNPGTRESAAISEHIQDLPQFIRTNSSIVYLNQFLTNNIVTCSGAWHIDGAWTGWIVFIDTLYTSPASL